jgi:hypothetical protein
MQSVELLSENLALFTSIKELSVKMETLISDGKIEAFLDLSTQRKQLQYQILEFERRYGAIMKDRPEKGMEEKVLTISYEIADVIRSVQEIDQNIKELIFEKRSTLFSDIDNINHD